MRLILMPIVWWSILLLTLPAWAQVTLKTECGSAGTGYVTGPTGRPTLQPRTEEQARTSAPHGTRVAADGWWTQCEAPVVRSPVPCPGSGEPREWVVDGLRCTSAIRNNASATDPSRDRGIADGDVALWRQWTGDRRGHLIERCIAGQRVEVGRTCAVATHCDTGWEDKGYKYRGAPVPIGGRVTLTKPGGVAKVLSCGPGAVWRVQ